MRIMNNYHQTSYNPIIVFICLFLSCTSYASSLELTFFDVGQGNGTLVTCGSCPPLLVDCGSSSHNYRGAKFKEQQINHITAALKACSSSTFFLVVSHPDEDHYNWLPEVLSDAEKNGRSVGNAWLGGMEDHYGSTKELINTLKGNLGSTYASKVIFPTAAGPTTTPITIHTTAHFSYSILPALPCGTDKAKESNAASLVVQILYYGKAILLTGDATAKTFKHIGALLPAKVLILLASHHGAGPSENKAKADACNDKDFIKATEPMLVIFSAGRRADYAHPRFKAITSYAQIQKTLGYEVDWHPLFCGSPSSTVEPGQPLLLTLSDKYGVVLTKQPLFSTLTHGTITCKITRQLDGSVGIESIEMDNPTVYDSAKKAALLFPLFEATDAFAHSEISAVILNNLGIEDTARNDGELLVDLLKVITDKCPQIKNLILNNNTLSKAATFDALISLLQNVDVREFELEGSGIQLREQVRQRILEAWNLRGLKLQPALASDDDGD